VGGVGVVTFAVDREFLPIYRDATMLMRPTTGLKDMFFQLDPGSRAAGEFEEGDTISVANTAPDVNLEEILAALDSDTQAYLRLLLVGAGQGLAGRDRDLGRLLGSLGPINKDLARLNSKVRERKRNLANLIHNLGILTREIGRQDADVQEFVSASNDALSAIAEQDLDVQRATALLPGTLRDTRNTLLVLDDFGRQLGPTFNSLRPFARQLDDLNASLRTLADEATPILRDEIRPFVRAARPVIPDLNTAARRFSAAAPRLTAVGSKINRLGNMAAYNPRGAEPLGAAGRDEGYLFWAAWLGHTGNLVFNTADANGPFRRIYFTLGCSQAANLLGTTPTEQLIRGIITGIGPAFATLCP
jgi:phospholipid/cholesterol/gamma-HCH transport system substrate-binding protein